MKSKKEAKIPQKATKASPVDSKPSKKPKATPPGNYHFDSTTNVRESHSDHKHSFSCTIYGVPRPQYRGFATMKSTNRKVHLMSPSKANQDAFRKAFRQALEHTQQDVFDKDPDKVIMIDIKFFFPRPKHHYWFNQTTKKWVLNPTAPVFVTKIPDLDNLVKLVLDSLQDVCYKADNNIASITTQKLWSNSSVGFLPENKNNGRTVLEITQIDELKFDSSCTCASCNNKKKKHVN